MGKKYISNDFHMLYSVISNIYYYFFFFIEINLNLNIKTLLMALSELLLNMSANLLLKILWIT